MLGCCSGREPVMSLLLEPTPMRGLANRLAERGGGRHGVLKELPATAGTVPGALWRPLPKRIVTRTGREQKWGGARPAWLIA